MKSMLTMIFGMIEEGDLAEDLSGPVKFAKGIEVASIRTW